jgi:pilus assembly protein FimV
MLTQSEPTAVDHLGIDFGENTLFAPHHDRGDCDSGVGGIDLPTNAQGDLILGETAVRPPDELREDDLETLSGADALGTKLNLAKVYIDMGDSDGALSKLKEVLQEGDENQRREAEELIKKIP